MADFGGKPGGNDGIARALGQQAGEFEENLSDFISFEYYFKEEFLFCCLQQLQTSEFPSKGSKYEAQMKDF